MKKDKMQNLLSIREFENANNLTRRRNGDFEFEAEITYEFGTNEVSEILTVVISNTTWEAGRIDLNGGLAINVDRVHCRFEPGYQTYTCNEDGMLVISDSSDKLGEYKVTINPT
jgi:hypothetical protein